MKRLNAGRPDGKTASKINDREAKSFEIFRKSAGFAGHCRCGFRNRDLNGVAVSFLLKIHSRQLENDVITPARVAQSTTPFIAANSDINS
ncbi:hypothetical protein QCE63_18750 [Caballeronia sp. LZ065]|nr:hypothetical protein [Caballeronia sp. LZ065]